MFLTIVFVLLLGAAGGIAATGLALDLGVTAGFKAIAARLKR